VVFNFIFKVRVETRAEKEKKKRRDILERGMKKTEEALENWNPHEDPKAESDPFRTLFVARINFDTSQSKLKREFEEFGRIRHVSISPVFAVYNNPIFIIIHCTVLRQRLTHFHSAQNLKNASIFGVPISDCIFPKFFGEKKLTIINFGDILKRFFTK